MFILCRKLKATKEALRVWARNNFGNGTLKSTLLRQKLIVAQEYMVRNPDNAAAAENKRSIHKQLNDALKVEGKMKRQQLRLKWAHDGDNNTAYFHAAIKIKQAKENISHIYDEFGVLHSDPDEVDQALLNFFKSLLGNKNNFEPDFEKLDLVQVPLVQQEEATNLVIKVTDKEIKDTFFHEQEF